MRAHARCPAAAPPRGHLATAAICLRAQVDEVKGIMTENIEKVLARGEKLELLTDKTENLMFEVGAGACRGRSSRCRQALAGPPKCLQRRTLQGARRLLRRNRPHQADRFVRTGRTLRRKMWWQNCKMKIVVAFAVILLAVIIFLLVRAPPDA